jgi:RHS repeat-associated protein
MFTYTATGQRQTVVDARGTTTYTYVARNRLLSRADPDGTTISYTYDGADNELSVTIPAGTTTYTYDALNRMETVTDPSGGVTRYQYDQAGNLVRTGLPNGTVETRQYDDLNRLVFLKNTGPDGSVISSYQYTLSPTGLITGVMENTGRTVTYLYDGDYRLTEESIVDPAAGNRTIEYTYDAVGNRLTRNDSTEGLTTDAYDANDRLRTETLGGEVTNYGYDNNGNLVSQASGANDQASYTWDFANRLVGATITDASGTHHLTNLYDTDGNRVEQTADGTKTMFLVDTNRPLAQDLEEYTPQGVVQVSYVQGLRLISQDRGGALSFYLVDGSGSTRALLDPAGSTIARYTYDAFGRLLSPPGAVDNSYLYDGEQFDPNVSAYYLRAGYYDMALGSFLSGDPLAGRAENPLSLQRYLYADASPVNKEDPSGKETTLGELMTGLAIAAGPSTGGGGADKLVPSNSEQVRELLAKGINLAVREIDLMLNAKEEQIGVYFKRVSSMLDNPHEYKNDMYRYNKLVNYIITSLSRMEIILDSDLINFTTTNAFTH